MSDEASIRVSKISGVHRQLKTAITLWGRDDDPVAVHTLAVAAWVALIKKSANFFKHADRDPDAILDFDPGMNEWYILYATAARQLCGEAPHGRGVVSSPSNLRRRLIPHLGCTRGRGLGAEQTTGWSRDRATCDLTWGKIPYVVQGGGVRGFGPPVVCFSEMNCGRMIGGAVGLWV